MNSLASGGEGSKSQICDLNREREAARAVNTEHGGNRSKSSIDGLTGDRARQTNKTPFGLSTAGGFEPVIFQETIEL